MTWVGVDDTDSLTEMCTTYLATEVIRRAPGDLLGYPRLVRLNPNVPWKTRGNGALCLRFGRGRGEPSVIGRIAGRDVLSYPRGDPVDPQGVFESVGQTVEDLAVFDDPSTNPGVYVSARPTDPGFYWAAVREIVPLRKALSLARGGLVRGWGNRRGVIGAVAATAWRPRDRTYEVIAYRDPGHWGTPRDVDAESVRRLDAAFPETFNNYDEANHRPIIAPHSPCPILFGIRSDSPDRLIAAMHSVRGELPERWLLFETNQGTDDHVLWRPGGLRPHTTVAVAGVVRAPPRTLPGGHVVFPLRGRWEIDCTAYEPSKQFRDIVRRLAVGDRVTAVGAVRERPRTLNLEKLRVIDLAPVREKVANPACPCGRRMKSLGRSAGYRCRACGERAGPEAATYVDTVRTLAPGWYEPTVTARRHLSKPLKRMGSPRPQGMAVTISIPSGRTK